MDAVPVHTPLGDNQANRPTVLCVDDEQSILASLKRALRKQPFTLLIANSGQEALEILSKSPVDLVVSDMRMPGMNGAELLAKVHSTWPDTVRMLLTGYSDMESTVSAINEGRIFRYLNKPWNNEDLVVSITSALEHKRLKDENATLTELTRQQNDELKAFNDELESKVEARTKDLALANQRLNDAYSQLNSSYNAAIRIFAQLIELRDGETYSHSRAVARTCEEIGKAMSLSEDDLTELNNAALLHDVGKLGFSDDFVATPYSQLKEEEKTEFHKHPTMGQAALFSIPALDTTSLIIRAHHERVDGTGYPDGLKGDAIPLAARIISVAADFDDLQRGLIFDHPLDASKALAYLSNLVDKHYDRSVVDALAETVRCKLTEEHDNKLHCKLHLSELMPGMMTAQAITASNGMLLIDAGETLTDTRISHIQQVLADTGASEMIVMVRPDNVHPF
ncbi:MAG: HD domain-containing phosphohydrolase [Granulosicoccus sp.]